MPTPAPTRDFRYEVELEDGQRFEVELEGPLPDGDAGRKMLEEIVAEQLAAEGNAIPVGTSRGIEVARGVVGGLRDFAQQGVDLPVGILNTALSFINPQPPGQGRQPPPIQVETPQLPDPTGEPQSGLERGTRTATTVAADVLSVLLPVGKTALARRAAKRTPMLFEKGSARGLARRPDLSIEPSSPASRPLSRFDKPVPTKGVPPEGSILTTKPSTGARNLAKLFEFSADDIPKMSLEQASAARRRILTQIPDFPIIGEEGTPLGELLMRLERRILSFR